MDNKLDTPGMVIEHSKTIQQNKFLKMLYRDFYNRLIPTDIPTGQIIELGSGGGFIKEIIPTVKTSDVVAGPGIDMVFSALNLPFKNNSIAAFVMLNTFHHFKEPEMALSEMSRCLMPGGKIIMVEPFNSPWGSFFYRNFHYEGFDPEAGWSIEGQGRLSDANNALPWIIFVRDRKKFLGKFPILNIINLELHTPVAYLISGGLNHAPFLPHWFFPAIKFVESILSVFKTKLAMFFTVEIQKQGKT